MDSSLSWTAWWINADTVVRGIFILLIILSLAGWTIIIAKWWQLNEVLGRERNLRKNLEQKATIDPALSLLRDAVPSLGEHHSGVRWETYILYHTKEKRVELESGLTFLASIGVATPFIGLLGTVWGIMHALAGLNHHASLSLDLVAGPVAEALVATAAGLFAAIPAVVGYNLLIRRLRRLMTAAEGNLLRIMDMQTQGGIDGKRTV